MRNGDAAAREADRHDAVVEVAEVRELGIDERLPCNRHLDGLVVEEPARRVVVVRRHVQQKPARVPRILASGPLGIAAREQDDERRPAVARPNPAVRLHETGVVAPHVADLNHLSGASRALEAKSVVLRQRRGARLLQKQVLARPQDSHGEATVVHRAGGQDNRVDIVPGEELRVGAMSDSEPPPHLLGAALTGRGHGHQFGSGKPLGVLGMERAHPAETGDAEPKRTRRP